MQKRRFYVMKVVEGEVRVGGDEAFYARKVLRLRAGDKVELFDGNGVIGRGEVIRSGRELVVVVREVERVERGGVWIDLGVALPKGQRAGMLIEKAAELGADRLIPLATERGVVEAGEGKLKRFERIAIEAAKQCGAAYVMEVAERCGMGDVVARGGYDLKLIGDVSGEGVSADENVIGGSDVGSVGDLVGGAKRVIVLIGPEGGWTDGERRMANEAGFVSWTFGENVLRIETAAIAAMAILRWRYRAGGKLKRDVMCE